MKTRLLIIIVIGMIGFVAISSQHADGICVSGTDWDKVPCESRTCFGNEPPAACTDPKWWKKEWAPYYDYKGAEWMNQKKIELLDAMKTDTLTEWKKLTPNGANNNVYDYYFYMGEVPNHNGIYVKQYFAGYFPPLKQFKSGIAIDKITCKEGLVLITRSSDESPACVKPKSKTKLIQREWAIDERTPKETAIDNIKETIPHTTYKDQIQLIQKQVDEKNLNPFSAMLMTDLKDKHDHGEKITFNLTLFGYSNYCLTPQIALYIENYEKPIYEGGITMPCPAPMEKPVPRVGYWTNDDFPLFPTCRYPGLHTIVGESFGFGPETIGTYYCNGKEKFEPPKVIQVVIPKGASDPNLAKNFEPSEIHLKWGDYVTFINKDTVRHIIIGDSGRVPSSTGVEFYFNLEPGKFEQTKIVYDGEYWIRSEYPNDGDVLPWMNATIYVD